MTKNAPPELHPVHETNFHFISNVFPRSSYLSIPLFCMFNGLSAEITNISRGETADIRVPWWP